MAYVAATVAPRPQPQAEFVQKVMDHLGLSQTDLGVALRKGNAYQTVHGWLTGRAKLGYDDTMQMLEMCGWLDVSDEARDDLSLRRDRLAALEARVAELPTAEDLGVAVETLRQAIDRLAKTGTRAAEVEKPSAQRHRGRS